MFAFISLFVGVMFFALFCRLPFAFSHSPGSLTHSAKLLMRSSKFGLLHLFKYSRWCGRICAHTQTHLNRDRSGAFGQPFHFYWAKTRFVSLLFWYGQVVIFCHCVFVRYRVLNRIILYTRIVEIVKRNMINAFSPSPHFFLSLSLFVGKQIDFISLELIII